ncbi:coil containing protein [Vibrio phage 1.149.O._10N.286.55.A12]|nr:coil containing protein [Vibrio phage 1.149.O._10N.286.55.A12]
MRYILDERVGCAAVIDTNHPEYDPDYPGLHSDTGGVVLYESFTNQSKMNISESEIEAARLIVERLKRDCKTLNVTAPRTKTEFVKVEYNHAWEIIKLYEGGEELFKTDSDELQIERINSIALRAQAGYPFYRKVETEIDERQEFIEECVSSIKSENSCDPMYYNDWFGQIYDSGKFKLVEK